MGKVKSAKAFIGELRKNIGAAEERKRYFESYLKRLYHAYISGKISFKFYIETLHLSRDGRNIQQWIEYYDNYIKECKQLIEKHKKSINKIRAPVISAVFIAIILAAFFLNQINLQTTGFAVQNGQEIATEPGVNAIVTTIQQQAVLNQPVKWIKKVSLERPSSIKLILPSEAENISSGNAFSVSKTSASGSFLSSIGRITGFVVQQPIQQIQMDINKTNSTDYEISYETPAPTATEQNTQSGKIVRISGPDIVHYTNVLVFTNLSESLHITNPSQVKIYWQENGSYITPLSVKDTNYDGIYDYVSWIAPHLSNQTYVIIITDAQWLSANRSFIRSIYSYVNQTDNITFTIPKNDYVRAFFAANLTNKNVIDIFVRDNESASILVYEESSNTLVGRIDNVTYGVYYISLPDLKGSQDVFDLKSVGNSVSYDFIHDGKPGIFVVDNVYYAPNATGALNTNDAVTAYCIFEQAGSGATGSGSVNTYLQFNTSSSGWANMSSSTAITVNGSNPDTGSLSSVNAPTNTSQPAHNLVFTQTGTYNVRCYEPAESADGSSARISGAVQYIVSAPPSNIKILLNLPVNSYNSSSSNITFNGTAVSYQYPLSNVSVFTNISGSWTANQTNSSPINNTPTVFTITGIPNGVYRWNYRSCDSNGACNFSSLNNTFLVDTIFPIVTLSSPVNSQNSSSSSITFSGIANDNFEVSNVSIYTNTSGTWAATQTNSSPINNSQTNFTISSISDGVYVWNYQSCDPSGNCAFAAANRTLTIDTTSPVITLPVYTNATFYRSTQSLIFNVSVTDSGVGPDDCSVNVAGNANQTVAISSGWCNGTYALTGITDGNQTINAYANDTLGNTGLNNSYVVGMDSTAPTWSNNQTNSTKAGEAVQHSLLWSDNNELSGYIFSFDNGTGTFVNDSFIGMTGVSNWSNVTKSVNFTSGSTIRWRFYTNDTAGNLNATDIFTYQTTSANSPPTIPYVDAISAANPTESGTKAIQFNFTAQDLNGASNLNDSSAAAYFQMAGQTTRSNTSCLPYAAVGNNKNYTCTIYMWYFDKPGSWTINATILDNSQAYGENSSTTFTYNQLTSMVVSPSSLSWGVLNLTSANVGATNNPLVVNNTGNAEALSLNVTAYNLVGEQNGNYFIYADNFSVDNVTAGCSGTSMLNATSVNVTNAVLQRGNNTMNYNNATSGQEELYICLRGVPQNLITQSYSSSAYGSWIVKVLLVAVIPATRRKKKQKKKGEDKLLGALDLIIERIKEDSDLKSNEVVEKVIERVADNYGISKKEISEMIGESISIPVSIFSKELGALESIVKYMKENLKMSYSEIAKAILRDERTVWTSYKKAKGKKEERFDAKTKLSVPLSVFAKRESTILESLILYLKNRGFKFSEIAQMLERDQRNIWTVYSRAKNKINKINE